MECDEKVAAYISEFSDDDLMDDFIRRLKRKRYDVEELAQVQKELDSSGKIGLEDIIKREHFFKVKDKYTSAQIEAALPI
jgi:hypothetical protein